MITIEKGIPLPKNMQPRHADEIPWAQMEIGDSFVFETRSCGGLKLRAAKHGIRILIKGIEWRPGAMKQGHGIRYRIWRIA